jgi:peptide/nickel transport system permease protein
MGKFARLGFWLSGLIVLAVIALGCIAPMVPYEPADAVSYDDALVAPSFAHVLGTDEQGRDIAIRLVKGTEAFFLPGLMAAAISIVLGSLTGALTGYATGFFRTAVLGALQLLDTLPRLVFIILVCTIRDPSVMLIAFVAGILFIPTVATVIRRKVESLASEDYILAHIAHGFSPARVLLHHILWLQCWPILVRQAAYVFGYVLFVETGLSYLGDYGVQEPDPSWGNMVAQVRTLPSDAPWPWLIPAAAIVLTISGFLAFGNLAARRGEEAVR